MEVDSHGHCWLISCIMECDGMQCKSLKGLVKAVWMGSLCGTMLCVKMRFPGSAGSSLLHPLSVPICMYHRDILLGRGVGGVEFRWCRAVAACGGGTLTQMELVGAVVAGLTDLLAVPAQRVEGTARADQQACRGKKQPVSQSVRQNAGGRVFRLPSVRKPSLPRSRCGPRVR